MRIKHDKKGKENTIGKIIYGFLLFMPLLAIGVTCLTNIFNKEDSLSVEEKYETNEVNSLTDLKEGNIYKYTYLDNTTANGIYQIRCTDIYNFNFTSHIFADTYSTGTEYLLIEMRTSGLYIRTNANQTLYSITLHQGDVFEFDFVFLSLVNTNDYSAYCDYSSTTFNVNVYGEAQPRENAFYRAIDKVQQSPLFNWANNTATYNVLQSTCNTLGIKTLFVPMLLSYWLMISLVYLLYDIALLVVHMAHNKIHDIESNI